jgi:hypothetical protein
MSSSAPGTPPRRTKPVDSNAPPRKSKRPHGHSFSSSFSKGLGDELAEAAGHSITKDGSNESRAPMGGLGRRRRRKSRKKKKKKKKRKTKRRRKSRKKRTKRRRRR